MPKVSKYSKSKKPIRKSMRKSLKKPIRKSMRKSLKKSMRKPIRKSIRKSLKKFCRNKLSNKIKINMRETKSGNKRIKSPLQAIAIAYSQIRKKYPKCSKNLKKSKN